LTVSRTLSIYTIYDYGAIWDIGDTNLNGACGRNDAAWTIALPLYKTVSRKHKKIPYHDSPRKILVKVDGVSLW
jgi:hypothetical protein